MNKKNSLCLLIFIVVAVMMFPSCGVPKAFQHVLYLQDSVTAAEKIVTNTSAIIEPGDRLNINISAINKTAAADFNMITSGGTSGGSGSTGGASTLGYLVDSLGNIEMLQLGIVKAGGLTTAQLAANLQQQLEAYLKGAIVTVSISNFKVSVFGEVSRPGIISVPDGKLTILDALIQSGDISTFGRRDNILVVRETNGQRDFGRVDVNSNQVFLSPYYYLKQNDMIYVEADKTKFINNDPRLERSLRNLGIATTILSTVLLVINLVKR
ncbi:MAG: polysaccharide biosynthesis/export family protein [Bacteroidetes bacterium]|nr:polysaccharide biosynthesis/export family protein [Bacteroidota bacterium]